MEYTNIFEPMMLIFLSMLLGILIGSISAFYLIVKDNRDIKNELDKFRKLYFHELDKWKNKYIDDDPCDRFNNPIIGGKL